MAKKRTLSAVVQASASEGRQELNEETKSDDEHHRDAVAQDDGNDETEDSVYISVELTDFADFPILDKHDALEIENLESDRPILRIGEYRVRSRGVCKRHGGGRLCLIPDCQNSAVGLEYCVSHGGGKGCLREECTKAAQVGGYCKAHGGGSRCQVDGCKKSSQTNGRCRLHGGGKRCTAPGCTKGAQRLGLCAAHGGYHICQHESGCPRKDRGGGYCETHRRDLECSSVGCKRLRKAHGLCTTHLRVGDHNDLMAILDELLDMPKQRLR
ncbi:hypothetical protein DYB37_006038 [Aphanomyces astaci]|uniref:WRKY19-like zinc finger domain-containing protein n=1 Tax=Aphanomyces astaci TaxID=112090 RepID=A0A3R7CF21_APHAT|nr:hypothetical protein DYB35_004549 [Aphanomyces astaci]RHZ24208.1 hypothetical protein DYB37_006038 [Aphanomyces astaci]RQM23282.1 hypothetical protein B5M09_004457 [Aphanomyces astaci]